MRHQTSFVAAVLSVGGSYTLCKTVLEDDCGGTITTFVFTARVRHDPRARRTSSR